MKDVRITDRLTDSPACVVFDEGDLTGHMQRMLQAAGQAFSENKPVLEINPDHPIVQKANSESDNGQFASWTELLLNQALLAEGEQLNDPAGFVKSMNELILQISS